MDDVVVPICGSASDPLKSQLRRLHFEAFTMAAADLKHRIDNPSDEKARPMPGQERESRRRALAARLKGVQIKDDLEPCSTLIDRAAAMHEKNQVEYIKWFQCAKRSVELSADPGDASVLDFKPDSNGYMKASARVKDNKIDVQTALDLQNALTRRGLALEIGGVMTYESHQLITNELVHCMRPAGKSR